MCATHANGIHLVVGIPAYNEAASIADVIASVPRQLDGVAQVDVVVVDDGSTDDTAALAKAAGAHVIRHGQNRGVGVAFQSLLRRGLEVRTDVLVTIDGDGQFNPNDIPTLIAPILEGEYLVCTASRFLDPKVLPTMPAVKKWGNRRVAGLVSALTGHQYADVSCGFRAYARDALLRLTPRHSFTYTHETFLDLAARGVAIKEVSLTVRGVREHGESKIARSVWRYAWSTALIMLRTYRDQQPLKMCFVLAIPAFLLGAGLLTWSTVNVLETGSWLKWAAFTGAAAFALAMTVLFFGFMADMATRLRKNQEEILYWLRRHAYVDAQPEERASAALSAAENE